MRSVAALAAWRLLGPIRQSFLATGRGMLRYRVRLHDRAAQALGITRREAWLRLAAWCFLATGRGMLRYQVCLHDRAAEALGITR